MNTTHLAFYHPNGRGNGAAVRFSVQPAHPDRDGSIIFSIAKQKTVGNLGAENAADRYATFDWASETTVKLNFVEVAEMLMVFGGQAPALCHAGNEGLYHNTTLATVSVTMKRSEDYARPGFLLGVGHTPKADPNQRTYYTFTFTPAEALGIRFALMAQMGALAFGL